MSVVKEVMSKILDMTLEQGKDGYNNKLISFEMHKQRVKIESLKAFDTYVHRLEHGYTAIIQTIENNNLRKKA